MNFFKSLDASERFVAGFILLGGLFVWLYIDTVFIRNSIFYAGITQAITEHGLFSAHEYAKNKPLGFSVISWPLTQLFSVSVGLKLSSFFWTALWSLTALLLLRRMAVHSKSPALQLKLAVIVTLFNPLVFYQFISSYPDTLFASLFILSILFLDQSLSRNGRIWDSVIFSGFTLSCIWVKHHGFILLPLTLGIAWLHRADIAWLWLNHKKMNVLFFIASFGSVLLILAFAQAGMIPLFNLGHNVGNFTQGNSRLEIFHDNLSNLSTWFVISFGVLIPFLLSWQSFIKQRYLLPILLIFILPVLFYKGSQYNIRYFIAVTPFFAWVIASQLCTLSTKVRNIWFALFILSNGFMIIYYNQVDVSRAVRSVVILPKIDNLRLVDEQQKVQDDIDNIHLYAMDYDNTLIYVSRYYSSGTFKIWEKDGVFPEGLKVYYINRWKSNVMNKLGLQRAMVYEYLRPNSTRTIRKIVKQASKKKRRFSAKKISNSLYLLENKRLP